MLRRCPECMRFAGQRVTNTYNNRKNGRCQGFPLDRRRECLRCGFRYNTIEITQEQYVLLMQQRGEARAQIDEVRRTDR